jgi:hypothetical protein
MTCGFSGDINVVTTSFGSVSSNIGSGPLVGRPKAKKRVLLRRDRPTTAI